MPSAAEPPGQAATDSAAGAGDDGGLAREVAHVSASSPSSTRVVSVSVLLSTTRCCVAAWRSRKQRWSTLGPQGVGTGRGVGEAHRVGCDPSRVGRRLAEPLPLQQ